MDLHQVRWQEPAWTDTPFQSRPYHAGSVISPPQTFHMDLQPTPYAHIYDSPTTQEWYNLDSLLALNPRVRPYQLDEKAIERINEVLDQFNQALCKQVPTMGDYVVTPQQKGWSAEGLDRRITAAAKEVTDMERYPHRAWTVETQDPEKMPDEYSFTLKGLVWQHKPYKLDGRMFDLIGYSTRPITVDNYPNTTFLVTLYVPVKVWRYQPS